MKFKIRLAVLISTGAGAGYAPVAPGTVGSVWGIILCVILNSAGTGMASRTGISQPVLYLSGTAACFAAGVWASGLASKFFRQKDPGKIVIDEITGYLITMSFLPLTWHWLAAGFIVSRVLDILKIWPAGFIDRVCPGGWGIMLDDAVSGIQGALALNLVRWMLQV
ncbi:phosphatidylglycerophosphatase A [bacterium]|nr:phosphatidylglycerophosphatase A [candidate division CSSED10-310 bacterium]